MNLHTPPPSYEAIASVDVAQNQRNPYFYNAQVPTAPPFVYNVAPSAPYMTLPQPYSSAPYPVDGSFDSSPSAPFLQMPQPCRPISYSVARPAPQTNALPRRGGSRNKKKQYICLFILFIVLTITVVLVLIGIHLWSKSNTNNRDDKRAKIETNRNNLDWEDWRKNNDQVLQQIHNRRDEFKWNY